MATQKFFPEEITFRTMLRLANYLLALAWNYFFLLFRFIFRFIFRLNSATDCSKKDDDSNFKADHEQKDYQIASVIETEVKDDHGFVFGFRFQNYEAEHSVFRENSQDHNTSRYRQFTSTKDFNESSTSKYRQFNSTKDFRGFIEEPKTVPVHESFMRPNDASIANKRNQDSREFNSQAKYSIISDETEESVFRENSLNQKTSKYQFTSTKYFNGFIEDPGSRRFSVQTFSVGSNDVPIVENGNRDFEEFNSETEDSVISGKTEDSVDSVFQENSPNQKPIKYQFTSTKYFKGFIEEPESRRSSVGSSDFPIAENGNQDSEEFYSEAEDSVTLEQNSEQGFFSSDCDSPGKKETAGLEINHSGLKILSPEVELISKNEFWCFDFFEPKTWVAPEEIESDTDDLFPKCVADEESDNSKLEFAEKSPTSEENLSDESYSYTDDEFIELMPSCRYSAEQENLQKEWKSEQKTGLEKSCDVDWEDNDDLFDDVLSQHRESVEQRKMEMKNAKCKGMLPTILEECENPRMAEDLKPLRIDEKFQQKDRLEEIQMVYKGYAEKMRKLDVLNYQTLHGLSFIQLKDQLHRGSDQKSSVSAIKSLLFPNRRIYADPVLLKSITDLHKNLELVYVGQTCLSWEILYWQYRKAMEMLENDCGGNSSYNHVAGEFQQFQVLLGRFVENEPFQGPRVQNYAKNRCDIRSILQVPVVKDDSLKDKKDSTIWEDYEVSAAMLAQILDESMLIFWEFLEADKDEANVILKGIQSTNYVDLQDPSDSGLLMEIKSHHQKKEKRLKDILRTGNCLVKKFQKHQESPLSGVQLFAQVELKLVSRVLNMSRLTTDQLVWCQKKLNKVNFSNKKIHLEPSFSLFPI